MNKRIRNKILKMAVLKLNNAICDDLGIKRSSLVDIQAAYLYVKEDKDRINETLNDYRKYILNK